ncbi:class I SAM-dependent methyltransferase [Bacillus pinisoli]|uniref:class I SAM-dependent methyltransferase n=1 Tax=Bacillus pinisoli TaxID=2901866 RepID=UPI001FF50452|nr:SAM-dependent methyltransferase [Bacillus pinisoli]
MIEHIVKAIEQHPLQSISFSTFMELALYHPTEGYYMKQKQKIGKGGDFYTTSSVSPIFGEVLTTVFIELIEKSKVDPIIVELGGGNGSFARHIVETWSSESSATFQAGYYYIVETSPYHQTLVKEKVKEYKNVFVVNDFEQIKDMHSNFNGIIFSNEFFDAFPVDCVRMVNGEIKELRITFEKELKVLEYPLENKNIKDFLEEYDVQLSEGQTYEVPLSMCRYIENLGHDVDKAVIFTIDYGYRDEEWNLPYHREGSLRGYYQHQLITDPLKHVGEMDLTTHIHLDKLIKAGSKSGLNVYGVCRQDEFLVKAGILNRLEEHANLNPFSEASKKNRAIRSLIMQGGISSSFQVVVQTKNVDAKILTETI